ncbi:MAG: hypothetical protein H7Y88_08010 [Phycisphaerales bacterium]|nr:hypothetical protein [Phycisphaerales bacterium]
MSTLGAIGIMLTPAGAFVAVVFAGGLALTWLSGSGFPAPWATAANVAFGVLLVIGGLAMTWWTLRIGARIGWNFLASAYPATDPAPAAVRRSNESFSIDCFNWGCCVNVAADERYLHLSPAFLLRISGGKPASNPVGRHRVRESFPDHETGGRAHPRPQGPRPGLVPLPRAAYFGAAGVGVTPRPTLNNPADSHAS